MIKYFILVLIIQQLVQLNVSPVESVDPVVYGWNGVFQRSGVQWIYGSNVQIYDLSKSGHTSRALKVIALGVDQELIASSANDTTVRIWNTTSGLLVHQLDGHKLNVWSLAYLGNGQLASGSVDRTIRIWDIASGSLVRTLPTTINCKPNGRHALVCNRDSSKGHVNDVNTLSYMHDGLLASGSFDYTVRVWDTQAGALLKTFVGHTDTVKTVKYLPYNGFIASVSFDGTARIWDPQGSNQAKFVLTTDTSPINTLTDLKDGRIATAGNNSLVNIWDTNTGALLHTFNYHSDIVHALIVTDNGYLVSAGKDRTIRVYNIQDYTLRWTFAEWSGAYGDWGHRASIFRLVPLRNGLFATCSYDLTIKLWDTKQFIYLLTYSNVSVYGKTSHLSGIMSADYVREHIFATASRDWSVRVWRYDFYHLLCTYRGHTRFVLDVVALEDGYVASCSVDYLVKIWNSSNPICNQTLVWTTPYIKNNGHQKQVNVLSNIGNGLLASGSNDYTTKIWNWRTKTWQFTFSGHTDKVNTLLTLKNGWLADGSNDASIHVYRVVPGLFRRLYKLLGHTDSVTKLAQLANGDIVSASADFTVRVWTFSNNNYTLKWTLFGHWDLIGALYSLTNNRIASGSFDDTALVWDGVTGTLLYNLTHEGSVTALEELENGNLVTGCSDRLIRLYDLSTGSLVSTLAGHTSGIICLKVLPLNYLVSGSGDSFIKVWNLNLALDDKKLVSTYYGHTSSVNALAFLTNGYFASGSDDDNVIIWQEYIHY